VLFKSFSTWCEGQVNFLDDERLICDRMYNTDKLCNNNNIVTSVP